MNKIRVGQTDLFLDRSYVENKSAWYVLMTRCGKWLNRDMTPRG
jgi:hypothetical protein